MSDILITLDKVTKRYGRQEVLHVETACFRRGERVMISGPNGCGKSTLLRVLAGVSVVDGGSVRWAQGSFPKCIGFVPQTGGLYPELSLRENLRVRRRLFGTPLRGIGEGWHVTEVGLGNFLDKPVGTLSGGYQRLAAIAAAVDVHPTALFVDEPLNGIDERRGAVLRQGLDRLAGELELFVLTSPVLGDEWVVDREIRMKDGRIVDERDA